MILGLALVATMVAVAQPEAPAGFLPAAAVDGALLIDPGLSKMARAYTDLGLEVLLFKAGIVDLEAKTAMVVPIRENPAPVSFESVQPDRLVFPVAGRLGFHLQPQTKLGLLAYHRSDHDIDRSNAELNNDVPAHERYGVFLRWAKDERFLAEINLGPVVNRPVTDYLARGEVLLNVRVLEAGDVFTWFIRTRALLDRANRGNRDWGWEGSAELLFAFRGRVGMLGYALRAQRLEDEYFFGDEPQYYLWTGLYLCSGEFPAFLRY